MSQPPRPEPGVGPAREMQTRSRRWLPQAGAFGLIVLSCVPMLAMLPGAAAAALATAGVAATTGPWAAIRHALSPVAEPLLIMSILLLTGTTLRCGRGPAALVTVGGTTLFASMYLLTRPQPGSPGAMIGMGGSAPMAQTNAPLFYAGLTLIAATFVWSALQRHRRTCRSAWRRTPSPT